MFPEVKFEAEIVSFEELEFLPIESDQDIIERFSLVMEDENG